MSQGPPDRHRPGQQDAEQRINSLAHGGGAFVTAVHATRMPMVVTDPGIVGNPIIFANPAFVELSGYALEEILGRNYLFLAGEEVETSLAIRVRAAMAAHEDLVDEVAFQRKDGRRIWTMAFIRPVVEDGRIVQHFASFLDITRRVELEQNLKDAESTLARRVADRTSKLEQANERLEAEVNRRSRIEQVLRDTLLEREEDLRYRTILAREIDHRTKNALQTAAAMLMVQAAQAQVPAVADALTAATGRLQRMADIHALLYLGRQPDIVDVAVYLRRLAVDLGEALQPLPGHVRVEVEADDFALPADGAVSLGLFVGEAVTNAMKHAFPDGREGRVLVSLRRTDGIVRLDVEDDGVGLSTTSSSPIGIGLQLMRAFADRLRGQVTVEPGRDKGVRVRLSFAALDAIQEAAIP